MLPIASQKPGPFARLERIGARARCSNFPAGCCPSGAGRQAYHSEPRRKVPWAWQHPLIPRRRPPRPRSGSSRCPSPERWCCSARGCWPCSPGAAASMPVASEPAAGHAPGRRRLHPRAGRGRRQADVEIRDSRAPPDRLWRRRSIGVVDVVHDRLEVFPGFPFLALGIGPQQERGVVGRHDRNAMPVLPPASHLGDA